MVCYTQHFSHLRAGTERRVYHNTPARQWRPIMQLATGRLLLRCVTSRCKGPRSAHSASVVRAMAAWRTQLTGVLECAGLADLRARYPAVVAAAAAVLAQTISPGTCPCGRGADLICHLTSRTTFKHNFKTSNTHNQPEARVRIPEVPGDGVRPRHTQTSRSIWTVAVGSTPTTTVQGRHYGPESRRLRKTPQGCSGQAVVAPTRIA
jgi:hypothetical protein